jgi:hypothetical protein
MFVFPDGFDETSETVKVACCEEALWLMRRSDEYPAALTNGLSQASAGSLSATFDKSFVAPLVADRIIQPLTEIGLNYIGGSGNTLLTQPLSL